MATILDEAALTSALTTLPKWRIDQRELVRSLTLPDFKSTIAFVNRVADLAETANHHPDIDIRYNKVRLALVTHDSGGITQKDVDLAKSIEVILPK
jgi:4a-hydroxytetrahydrobiopterin dehydratase